MSRTQHDQTIGGALSPLGLDRRKLLIGSAGAIGLALVAGACGSDEESSGSSTANTTGSTTAVTTADTMSATPSTGSAEMTGDLKIAQLAAGLEVLAVNTYQAALDAATGGNLGEVPPAVAEYVTTALAQHTEQRDAWNAVITAGGGDAVTEPNATLNPVVAERFAAVTDVAGAALLALDLEAIAAQTYLTALPVLEDPEAIMLAGSIQIIDQQHQAILYYTLGEYPVPDVFQKVDKAVAA